MSAILSKDEIDSALRNLKIIEEQQEREDKLTEAKRKQTQEIENKQNLLNAWSVFPVNPYWYWSTS